MFRRFPIHSHGLREDCVSRPAQQDFRYFLNKYKHLHADYVSRRLTINPDRNRVRRHCHRRSRLWLDQLLSQPTLPIVVAIASVPLGARPPMPLTLARHRAANLLADASTDVRQEPSTTDSARALSTHGSGVAPGHVSAPALSYLAAAAWVSFDEQGWVSFGER